MNKLRSYEDLQAFLERGRAAQLVVDAIARRPPGTAIDCYGPLTFLGLPVIIAPALPSGVMIMRSARGEIWFASH